jgi:GntR family transcriptional regulator/MocR family aminotransferase
VLAEGELDEPATVAAAAEHGVGLEPLGLHRFEPDGQSGLILGYGALAEPALERAVALLAAAVV